MLALEQAFSLTQKKLPTAFLSFGRVENFQESEGKELATALKDLAD
jgi:hypothetical protein